MPLKIFAANYRNGRSVVFDEGDLFSAIKASMAVPGLFKPVHRDGMLLIDGGVTNEKISANPPDLYIKPRLHGIRLLHFGRIDTILEQSREAATELGEELDRWQAIEGPA